MQLPQHFLWYLRMNIKYEHASLCPTPKNGHLLNMCKRKWQSVKLSLSQRLQRSALCWRVNVKLWELRQKERPKKAGYENNGAQDTPKEWCTNMSSLSCLSHWWADVSQFEIAVLKQFKFSMFQNENKFGWMSLDQKIVYKMVIVLAFTLHASNIFITLYTRN